MLKKNKKKILLCCRKSEKYSDLLVKDLKPKADLKIFFSRTYNEKLPKYFYKFNYDYIINFRSYLILNKKILKKAKYSINFHPSLPKYRGVGCANYAIMNNEKYFCSTINLVNDKIDSVKIINVKKFKLSPNPTLKYLLETTHRSMFLQALNFVNKLLKDKINIEFEINKNKYKWSKQYNNLIKLNKFYNLDIKFNKKKFKKYLRATIIDNFRPSIKINGEIFFHVPTKNRK
jgi:methionyl-tRNA formyltransferase